VRWSVLNTLSLATTFFNSLAAARRRPRWLIVGFIVGVAGSFGACKPTPPVCGAPECQPGEVRTCLDLCVTPVPLGGSCSKDPCASNGICDNDALCINGICQNEDHGVLAPCNPNLANQCANSTYCPLATCPAQAVCSNPIDHGYACDSNFSAPKCRPCEPGTECVEGFCFKPCQTDADCPCDDDLSCAPTGFCQICKKVGDTDCGPQSPCCDGSTCGAGRCCFSTGHACSSESECCGTNVCLGGICSACTAAGAACTTDAQCCGTATCKSGVCTVPCTAGLTCTVPGAKGECSKGKTACTPTAETCTQVINPTAETCDGKDNNCNGLIDDVIFNPPDCSVTPTECAGQVGFVVKGKQLCQGGNVECVVQEGKDYCTTCGSAECGACGATPCVPGVTKCAPGRVCKTGATLGCNISDPSTSCWPIDGGHCSGCSGMKCWTPAQVTLTGQCP
jgi:hypothetical protein